MFFTTLIWFISVYKISGCCWFCIHFWIKWEWWKTFDTKMIGWTHFNWRKKLSQWKPTLPFLLRIFVKDTSRNIWCENTTYLLTFAVAWSYYVIYFITKMNSCLHSRTDSHLRLGFMGHQTRELLHSTPFTTSQWFQNSFQNSFLLLRTPSIYVFQLSFSFGLEKTLEQVCCKKQQKSPNQETGLGNRGRLKDLNGTKLVLN